MKEHRALRRKISHFGWRKLKNSAKKKKPLKTTFQAEKISKSEMRNMPTLSSEGMEKNAIFNNYKRRFEA